jgi:glutamate synthase domain-containing protein 2
MKPFVDLISPNRFPFYNKWKEKEFFEFIEELSSKSWGKPVWVKIVISDKSNIEPIAKQMAKNPKIWPDFITIDWWDWWSWAAPIYLSILFWKIIYDALKIANKVLKEQKVRDKVKIFASSKLYTPYMSARALALWADAIWNARSIMISAGCIRAWLCSWEQWACPVWLATMKKSKRRAYKQAWDKKVKWISNFIKAHNKWLVQVASIVWVDSPHKLNEKHIAKKIEKS